MMISNSTVVKTLQNKFSVTHTLFDFYEVEKLSQRYKNQLDETSSETLKCLDEKVESLTPTNDEISELKIFHARIKNLLSYYINERIEFGAKKLIEVADIGSFKMATMLRGHMTSDIMCMYSGPPTHDDVHLLAIQIQNDLTCENSSEDIRCQLSNKHPHAYMITSFQTDCNVVLWPVTQYFDQYREGVHIPQAILKNNLMALKHVAWFGEYAIHESAIIQLIRLLKDMKNRNDGFKSLNPWLTCLLAHYSVTNNYDRKTLTLDAAYKRCLKLLSAGLLLPHSIGIVDPCDDKVGRSHMYMSLQQQDLLCSTAQTLLRLYNAGSIERIFEVLNLEIQDHLLTDNLEYNVLPSKPIDQSEFIDLTV